MEQSNGSQPKSITFRIHHGNKTKICIFEDEMSWQQIQQQLTQTFPSLDHVSDWHGEYDYGTWIEDTHDWSIAVLYYRANASKKDVYEPFELFIVIGNDVVGGGAPNADRKESGSGPPPTKKAKLNDGKSLSIYAKKHNDKDNKHVHTVIPPPTCPALSQCIDLNDENENVCVHTRAADDTLWMSIQTILKQCRTPVQVLWIRHKFSGTLPQVKQMNKVLYEQLRKGTVIKYPPQSDTNSQKPLWALCPIY